MSRCKNDTRIQSCLMPGSRCATSARAGWRRVSLAVLETDAASRTLQRKDDHVWFLLFASRDGLRLSCDQQKMKSRHYFFYLKFSEGLTTCNCLSVRHRIRPVVVSFCFFLLFWAADAVFVYILASRSRTSCDCKWCLVVQQCLVRYP